MTNLANTAGHNNAQASATPPEQWTAVINIIESLQDQPGALLPILHAVQARLGFIPDDLKPEIATRLHLSAAEVHGVISFYPFFRTRFAARHTLEICRAESCQAMGSRRLEAHIKHRLGVDYHQNTADGMVSLEPVYCLGNCACSPAIRLDDKVYANMNTQAVDALLDQLHTEVVEVK